jgi:hypothetical protein
MKQTDTRMAEHTRSNLKTNATNKTMKETTQQTNKVHETQTLKNKNKHLTNNLD